VIDGKAVGKWEEELSAFNSKTLDFKKFKAYLKKKNEVNAKLAAFYQKLVFRKHKLRRYAGRQMSEACFLNRFKEMFGGPEDTIVAIGDWSEGNHHMRFHEPTKGKGFRTMFRKAGYQVFLVDEYLTSARCSFCQSAEGVCEPFKERENPRPWKSGKIPIRGLLRCKTCKRLWNRDTNAALNIWKIAKAAINGEQRPAYLQRGNASFRAAVPWGGVHIGCPNSNL